MALYTKRKHVWKVMLGLLVFTLPLILKGSRALTHDYQSGPIVLKNTPGFGEETDWKTQFYHSFCDITVAPDGSIFIASSRQHSIFKFDAKGSLIKSFGQKGQGPGDFDVPSNISILDGKYLVVGEYALNRRISLFDLDGNFVKLLKTDHSVFSPTALRDGKVAYIDISHRDEDSRHPVMIQTVFIKDIISQEEIKVCTYKTRNPSIRMKSGGGFSFGDMEGWTILTRTKEGNLAVGFSMEPLLTLFSPEGQKLTTFSLKGEPVRVTKSIIRRFKETQIKDMKQDSRFKQGVGKQWLKELEKASFDHLFEDYLPRYREILTDEEGYFLVFRREDCFDNCPIWIDVYSPAGKYVCETQIKTGEYKLIAERRPEHMYFTKNCLFALVQPKDSDEFQLKLIKVI
ncbi:MAG: 6-bladed beta-propeller [Candidatus Aminicenantes bacterium]|nr:6-bladed beta-propeller [Candidatus Aminicenantes bacterium]